MKSASALKDYLEKLAGVKISDSEYQEHKQKLVQFFSLLIEIDKKIKKKERGGEKIEEIHPLHKNRISKTKPKRDKH